MEKENEIDITITIKLAIKWNGDSTNARELKLNGRNEPPIFNSAAPHPPAPGYFK